MHLTVVGMTVDALVVVELVVIACEFVMEDTECILDGMFGCSWPCWIA